MCNWSNDEVVNSVDTLRTMTHSHIFRGNQVLHPLALSSTQSSVFRLKQSWLALVKVSSALKSLSEAYGV